MASTHPELRASSSTSSPTRSNPETNSQAEDGGKPNGSPSTSKGRRIIACNNSGVGGQWFKTLIDCRAVDLCTRFLKDWNRIYILVCAAGLMIDPLFFYTLSISHSFMCLFIDGWFAITVTVLRCMLDAMHVCNIVLQLKVIYSARFRLSQDEEDDSAKDRCRSVVSIFPAGYLKSVKGFFLDVIVVLPVMQVVTWIAAPALIQQGSTTTVMTVFLIMFLFQYIPKIYHSVCFMRRMQNNSGYIFGTIWWGIALNLMAYFVASHAVGACWYLLGIQRATKCLKEQCAIAKGCGVKFVSCTNPVYYGKTTSINNGEVFSWANNSHARNTCLDSPDNYEYGAYKWTLNVVANSSRLEKILLPIFWGLMTLSTFGNFVSTTDWLEIVFSIIIITSGLILVTMLIGNIKVFLHATTSKKQAMHLRLRNVEWWMKHKKLPKEFKHRVRQYERQRWAATRGVDEFQMISNLPEGLRRDIKHHLCLDLMRQVPLFHHMDDLVLENICDRVKSVVLNKGEVITREGDPVHRMLFIVRGHMQSSQVLHDGMKSYCMLGPGNFSGDELLSWCLRKPFIERLPLSSSTLRTLESVEAFGLEASDIKYVTQHFRYTFTNEKVRRSARYYSPGWRTWAAVAIQLAWRRYKQRKTLTSLSFIRPRRPLSRCSSMQEEKLRLYTAILTSPKPNQDEFLL